MMVFRLVTCIGLILAACFLLSGCNPAKHKLRADCEVYSTIDAYSAAMEGMPTTFDIERETEPFLTGDEVFAETPTLALRENIELAVQYSRSYRTEEERLYSQGLNLSSTRHLFEPRYFGDGSVDLENDDFAKTLSGFFTIGMNKMLETGTDISVDLTTNLSRIISGDDPAEVAASAFTASVVHPLLQGAGRHIAREPLTQEERDMVYAIRDFVRFRKVFTVDIAQRYFGLLQQLDQVENAYADFQSRQSLYEQTVALAQAGNIPPFQVDQAGQDVLESRDSWIRQQQSFENAVDDFKVVLGLPIRMPIEPDPEDLNFLAARAIASSDYNPEEAVGIALENRLDLKNVVGAREDAERQVTISADALQPVLDLILTYSADSDGRSEVFDFVDGDKFYGVGADAELPLDRKIEGNVYRQSLINLAAAERSVVETSERIAQDVRAILRELKQTEQNYVIRSLSLELAEERVERDNVLLEAGRAEVRDVLEAQDALLRARNGLTSVLVDHFNASLDLALALETLRIGDDGFWIEEF